MPQGLKLRQLECVITFGSVSSSVIFILPFSFLNLPVSNLFLRNSEYENHEDQMADDVLAAKSSSIWGVDPGGEQSLRAWRSTVRKPGWQFHTAARTAPVFHARASPSAGSQRCQKTITPLRQRVGFW